MLLTFSLESLLSALTLIVLVSLVARLFHLPYTMALVFAGLLSSFFPLPLPQILPETFLVVLLPPLVFEAAVHLDLSDVKENAFSIFGFAFVGTFISALLIGILSFMLLKLNFLEALLLGVINSPTDTVAIVSVFQELGVSKRLTSIVEGEALFNDGVAVVLYFATISAFRSGSINFLGTTEGIVVSIVVGTLVGFIVGYITCKVVSFTKDRFVQVILTFIATYASYQAASYLNGSGIVSVTTTGLLIGNFIRKTKSKETFEVFSLLWDFVSFIVTSVSFTLIGMYVKIPVLLEYSVAVALSIIIVLISRAITIYGISSVTNLKKNALSKNWRDIIIWSGLRGVISVMLVLGLPMLPIPHAEEIVAITFGIVFFSVLFQGFLVKFLIQKFNLTSR